jgi:hypothetical protein
MKTSPTVIKRGRGRPRKDETIKIKKMGKKRGRPLGSKNKSKKDDIANRLSRIEVLVGILADAISMIMQKATSKKAK